MWRLLMIFRCLRYVYQCMTNKFSFYYNEIFISYISNSKHMNNIKQFPFNKFQQNKCISFCVLLPIEINLINLVEMFKNKVSIHSFISFWMLQDNKLFSYVLYFFGGEKRCRQALIWMHIWYMYYILFCIYDERSLRVVWRTFVIWLWIQINILTSYHMFHWYDKCIVL